MKRLIAAASLAAFASSAFAVSGKPYAQVDIDRALPNIEQSQSSATVYPFGGSAPYEQLAVDRALPKVAALGERERTQLAASAGETRSDATADVISRPAVSPFAQQHDVIAPAP